MKQKNFQLGFYQRIGHVLRRSIVVMLFLFSVCGITQEVAQQKVDSVLRSISTQTSEEKIKGYEFIGSLILKHRDYVDELFTYTLAKTDSDLAQMILYQNYSQFLSQKGLTDESLRLKLRGLEIAQSRNDEYHTLRYYISIAHTHLYQTNLDQALSYLNKAERIALKEEFKDLLWNVYYGKGQLQGLLGDIEGNSDYYLKMWDATEAYGNSPSNRFVLYILIEHFVQAEDAVHTAKFTEILARYYEEAHPNMPAGHMPIQSIFEKRASLENITSLKTAIAISDSLNSTNSLTYNTLALADTYLENNRPSLALPYLEGAIAKIERIKKPQLLAQLLIKMAETQFATGNYREAYDVKLQETAILDSLNSDRMQRNIAELEVKFDTEQKERKILAQNLVIEKETRQKRMITIGLIALGVILLLSIFFFRKRLQYQKTITAQNESIQQQHITELKQKNKLLAMSSMIEGQEAERLRIAKDLHDSLGGLLSTVKAHFTTIQNEIEQLEQLNVTERTNDLIDEACLEVRRISHNMMPHALSISGLPGALEDLTDQLKLQGYEASLEISKLPENLENSKKVMIYRIVQEVISNIRKHAEANSILIQVLRHNEQLHIIIEDDGVGFEYDTAVAKGGLGLKSIHSRVDYLDGTINWDSQPGNGTQVTINIPIS
ncbi:ATP-binding protein [Altibacter sp. HG106]|uniref:ATP-binding protein n=1 Tax=Altibacter sp. HG106 TaxID=3023937 RepID=UPI002350CF4C|nr:sensor histidine kinase [Altibacter sp. HG106]MDC7996039.1 sensor histidine kinase [Altibacter sp. HG106]